MTPADPGGTFGELLRRSRRAAELTQEELAERAGVSVRSISELERGGTHVPRRDTIDLIMRALNLGDDDRAIIEAAIDRRRGPRPGTHAEHQPPVSSIDEPKHNLPRQLTSFVGRELELRELAIVLDGTALLTLTGAGGVGKTRLAEELVRERVRDYRDGVWLVELAGLADPSLVPGAVATVLGVTERPNVSVTQPLLKSLRTRQLLLVVDNCEHLVQSCAELIETLLRACPELQVLATSREPLGISGEVTWRVAPLALPESNASIERISSAAATRLFVERARAVQSMLLLTHESVSAIARICVRLDGIPLALELAAARLRAMSVHELARRLDDDPGLLASRTRTALPQHQTLRATIQWSFDLLDDQERRLFRRLAVFAGSWSLELAEGVCSAAGIETTEVLDLLTRLVDKSMVVMETRGRVARYRLLEPIKHYALEALETAGETTRYRARHAAVLEAVAQSGEARIAGPEEITSLDRLELEHANFRAALRWSVDQRDGPLALRLSTALWRFWERRGYYQEGCGWLEQALAIGDDAPVGFRGNALNALAMMHWSTSDVTLARPLAEQALSVCRLAGDTRGMAWALISLGMIAYYQADAERAITVLEESLPLARKAGDLPLLSLGLSALGRVLLWASGPLDPRVASSLNESLVLAQRAESRHATSQALGGLAELAGRRGDFDEATTVWQRALTLRCQLRDQRGIATSLERLAQAAAALGQLTRAPWLWGAAQAQREAIGLGLRHDEEAEHARLIGVAAAATRAEAFNAAWSLGHDASVLDAVTYAFEGQVESQSQL